LRQPRFKVSFLANMAMKMSGKSTMLDGMAKAPLINLDETPGRTVGRRTGPPDGLSTSTSRVAHAEGWRNSLGGVRIPRGVHRFASHDDADRWLWQILTRPSR